MPSEHDEADYLLLSGIQHYAFCPRQWGLIHVEGQWEENLFTFEGHALHARVDGRDPVEARDGVVICRSVPVASRTLGLVGRADVVEFHQCSDDDGETDAVVLPGRTGRWRPFPVEYKRGRPKPDDRDAVQLCAQAMCLEEMLSVSITEGAIYYGSVKRRQTIVIDGKVRMRVLTLSQEMHALAAQGRTPPRPNRVKGCARCSLSEICLPRLRRVKGVAAYMKGIFSDRELIDS